MSYTLRGRLDSRLLSALVPAVAAGVLALVLHRWWPVEVAALMVAVGLALDILCYDRVFEYQPGWVALPLGALELVLVMGLAYLTGVRAPVGYAIAFFVAAWAAAQILGQSSTRRCCSRTATTAASSAGPARPPGPRLRGSFSRRELSRSRRSRPW